jgi:hypothetical protein
MQERNSLMGIRRITDPTTSVKNIYEHGRTHGDRKPHDRNYPRLKPGLGDTGLGKVDPLQERVQNPEDRARTLNDVPEKSWLRGGSAGAMYPGGVDGGPSGSRYRRR